MESIFNEFEFIEKNLPDYYSNEDVALSDDLQKYIDGDFDENDPFDCRRLGWLMNEYGTREEAAIEMCYINSKLFISAYENWRKER